MPSLFQRVASPAAILAALGLAACGVGADSPAQRAQPAPSGQPGVVQTGASGAALHAENSCNHGDHCSHGDSGWYWKDGYCVSYDWCDSSHGHVVNDGCGCQCDDGYWWDSGSHSCQGSGSCGHEDHCSHGDPGWYWRDGYCVSYDWCDPSHGHVVHDGCGCQCDDGYWWSPQHHACEGGHH